MTTTHEQLQAFEKHLCKTNPSWPTEMLIGKNSNGRYSSLVAQKSHEAWQASRKQALEEAAALFNQPHVEYFGSSAVEMIQELLNDK